MSNALLLKLKLADEAAWTAMYRTHFAIEVDGQWRPKPGVSNIVELGVFKHKTGRMVTVNGMQTPELVDAPNPGFHVDFESTFVPVEVHPYLQNPADPRHVYAGNHVLAMPEAMVEAEETVMVTRGIGATVPDDQLARIELQLLRGKITPDMAEDRKAFIEAGIAIAESRAALAEKRVEREQAVEAARKAADERARVLALRDVEQAKRAAAVTALQALTGAARAPQVAIRDAAAAQANKLDSDAAAQATARDAAVAARDAADAVLDAERVKIAAARAARAAAKAALQ